MTTKKLNLILVHSFPTNSILLSGFIEYMCQYFNVYFIDLPGFTRKNPPLDKITFSNFTHYVEKRIRELKLSSYLLSGISFGFLIVNNIEIDSKCVGIIAMEPYINTYCLRMSRVRKRLLSTTVKTVSKANICDKIWKSRLFKWYYPRLIGDRKAKWIGNVILNEVDSRTFVQTAKLILEDKQRYPFHDIPYALVINDNDQSIRSKYVIQYFKDHAKKLLLVKTSLPHFPTTLTKSYFQQQISQNDIYKLINFFNGQKK